MRDQTIIYALRDPRDRAIRYIGQTVRGLSRARAHWSPSGLAKRENPYTANWLRSVLDAGLTPVIDVVECVPSKDDLDEAEIYWIAKCKEMGYPLTNLTEGGNKPPPVVITDDLRKARSERMMGHPGHWLGKRFTDEHKSKIAARSRAVGEERARPVRDNYGAVYRSVRHAAAALNLKTGNIRSVLAGRQHTTQGYKFTYVTD